MHMLVCCYLTTSKQLRVSLEYALLRRHMVFHDHPAARKPQWPGDKWYLFFAALLWCKWNFVNGLTACASLKRKVLSWRRCWLARTVTMVRLWYQHQSFSLKSRVQTNRTVLSEEEIISPCPDLWWGTKEGSKQTINFNKKTDSQHIYASSPHPKPLTVFKEVVLIHVFPRHNVPWIPFQGLKS